MKNCRKNRRLVPLVLIRERCKPLYNKFNAIPDHSKRKICKNVWKIYYSTKDVLSSDKSPIKGLFTYFPLTAFKIEYYIIRSKGSTTGYQ